LKQLPIRQLDLTTFSEKAEHDEIVRLVDEILGLHKDLAAAEYELDDRRFSIKQRITQVDNEIDQRVYELYDLTDEEIRLIEEG
jgi:predicted  nucleic acid-binding Zn-ribbon protein